MKSKYEYKVIRPQGVNRNMGWGFIDKLHEQFASEAESGWDFYREITGQVLVFRRLRRLNPID